MLTILLFLIFGLCSFFDRKMWGTYITPLNIVLGPIVIIYGLSCFYFGALSLPGVGYYIPSVLVMFLASLSIYYVAKRSNVNSPSLTIKRNVRRLHDLIEIKKSYLIFNLLVLILVIIFWGYLTGFRFWISKSEGILLTGIFAHLKNIAIGGVILSIAFFNENDRLLKIANILSYICLAVFLAVKAWLFIPIASGCIGYFFLNNLKMRVKYIVITSFLVPLFFYLNYYQSLNGNVSLDFVFNYVAKYFISGVAGFSGHLSLDMNSGVYPSYVILPFSNTLNFILGLNVYDAPSIYWSSYGGIDSNVKTIIGSLYVYLGVEIMFIYFFILSVVYYSMLFFLFSNKKRYNEIGFSLYIFYMGISLFSWFDLYSQSWVYYFGMTVPMFLFLFGRSAFELKQVKV